MKILFLLLLSIPAFSDCVDVPTTFYTCADGCFKTGCGVLNGPMLQFQSRRPGVVYSSCSQSGEHCTEHWGYACQWMYVSISYTTCNGNTENMNMSPCCSAGGGWMLSEGHKDTAACRAPEDAVLKIPIQTPRAVIWGT